MSKKHVVNSFLNLAGLQMNKTTTTWRNKLGKYGIEKADYEIIDRNVFLLKKLDVKVDIEKDASFLEGYHFAVKLVQFANANFYRLGSSILVSVGSLKFKLNNGEELFILNEVFNEKCYNLNTKEEGIIVIDIGMNVGISSIYFAGQANVKKVFSFEPFTFTYNLALENISINTEISNKISPYNFGLFNKDKKMEVEYSSEVKGVMGVFGPPKQRHFDHVTKEEIELRSVNAILEPIIREHQDSFIICKLDCEGSEFEIIDSLASNEILNKIDVYLIEWHYRDPLIIQNAFLKNDFKVIQTSFSNNISGIIYAFK